jgi:EmrB/QacA subfamily drug resistance transporter
MSLVPGLTEHNRPWWTLAAMCFALAMVMLDNSVVNVALPAIEDDLDTSLAALQLTINAYTLTFAVVLVTAGRLGDIYGRRRMFVFGVAVFALSSAVIGLAPNQLFLVAGRAVQGVGAAFMMPATLSIITNAFPAPARGKAIGTWAGVSGVALAVGPVVGGALTEFVSWRAIFFLNLPVAVGAVAVAYFAAHESRDETVERTIDPAGIAALTVGLTSLVLALVRANAWGWGSPPIVGLLVLAVAGLIVFLWVEGRVRAPMVDFVFFRSRTFLGASVAAFIQALAMMAVFFFIALFLQNILGYSPVEAGIRFLPFTVVLMLVSPISGRLADRIGPRPLIVTGLLIVSVSLFLQSRVDEDSGYGELFPAFLLMGLGLGLTISPMSTAAMNSVSEEKSGVASGILSMSRMIGGTFGVAALGALFQSSASSRLEDTLAGTGVTGAERGKIVEHLGAGSGGGALDGLDPGTAAAIAPDVDDAFVHALSNGMLVSMGIALLGAVTALVLIESIERPAPSEKRRSSSAALEAVARS